MSTATSKAVKARPQSTSSTERASNPFDALSDVNESDTEWWDDDENTSSGPSKTARPQEIPRTGVVLKPVKRAGTRKADKRYSVQKPTRDKSKRRQKKQNAKAGIKLITNFSKYPGTTVVPQPVQFPPSKPMPQMGCFVDLAALQALDGKSTQSSGGFWKSRKAKESAPAANPKAFTPTSAPGAVDETALSARIKPKGLVPSPLNLGDDLSPSDRPIVIGISIPSARLAEHTLSPQTASSDTSKILQSYVQRTPPGHSPETPTIIITSAPEGPIWSPLDDNSRSLKEYPRPASSIYSQSSHNAIGISTPKGAPPVPQMPVSVLESERQRMAAQRSYFSPDSDDVTTWGDEDTEYNGPSKSRIVSTCTVFEEDESPVLERTGRARSISAASKDNKHASISTVATRHRSKGWWTYIGTPFMTRSNTVATRGVFEDRQPSALPSLATAFTKATETGGEQKSWEKQVSPLTPATSTTINSEPWWDASAKEDQSKHPRPAELAPVLCGTRHEAQPSNGTRPFVLSDTTGLERTTTSMPEAEDIEHQLDHSMSGTAPAIDTSGFRGDDREVPGLSNRSNTSAYQSNNPFVQPRLGELSDEPVNAQSATRQEVQPAREAHAPLERSPPPPPYSPSPARPRCRAILPPQDIQSRENNQTLQYPASPGPVSPGLQQAMSSGGGIPMSNVPVPPAARRPINLNSGYPGLPSKSFTPEVLQQPSKKAQKAEAKRQRYEKEDTIARKAGGLWRGRGCISNRGCYGRSGAEGRRKRRIYCGLIAGFLSMMIVVVVLATTLHRKSNTVIGPSQWLNLTGFPPIYTGLSTVAAPINTQANTGCVFPATQWSCDLPKEQQASVAPNQPNQPNFLLQIQWDNSSSANATFANVTGNPNLVTRSFVGNPVTAGQFIRDLLLRARQIVTFVPNPAPPSFAEEAFLGATTDGIVSANKAGEPTPFYISFLPTTTSVGKRDLGSRQNIDNSTSPFPNITAFIPAPSLNPDGTAAPANLLPLPSQQPIRLYDRGLPSEHYGFYTYFDRSIFLKSITALNETNSGNGEVPDDENGGATESEAAFRCTWSQTRFLVQMWTRANATTRLLNGTSSTSSPGKDFRQPGSFPYPITITIDRHGGDPALKMLYCYSMNDREGIISTSAHINTENRGFGGTVVNPAPSIFTNTSDPSLGGFDGGTGGCSCQWTNFQSVGP